jgi:DNA-directed RNA polymerase subunit K/omega
MDELNELNENEIAPPEGSAELAEPAPPITSRFLFVDIAALRAKQLRRGARVRFQTTEGHPALHKAERVAMEEVRRGLVYYDVPPPSSPGRPAESIET